MAVSVRPIAARDESSWADLFTGYRSHHSETGDPEIVKNAWEWLLHREHALLGLVAVDEDDTPIALANLRWFARPDDGDIALFLDDLFTAPAAPRLLPGGHLYPLAQSAALVEQLADTVLGVPGDAAGALLREAAAIAAEGGAAVVRWMTADDNTTARRLYDRHATLTGRVTYDMPAASRAPAQETADAKSGETAR